MWTDGRFYITEKMDGFFFLKRQPNPKFTFPSIQATPISSARLQLTYERPLNIITPLRKRSFAPPSTFLHLQAQEWIDDSS
jgi:hypothetical protein